MKGYFSQLAHHTGLRFGPGATMSALSSGPATVSAPQKGTAAAAPPHVEEITFTVPAHNIAERANERFADPAAAEPRSPATESATASGSPSDERILPTLIEISSGSLFEESQTRFSDVGSKPPQPGLDDHRAVGADERFTASGQPPVQLSNHSPAPPESGPGDSLETVEIGAGEFTANGHRSAPLEPARRSDYPDEALKVTEPVEVTMAERSDREVFVRKYLKEVSAWVAATPETDESEFDRQPQSEPQRGGDVFALEHEMDAPPLTTPGRPQVPEAQDLNLSIGTISIVIEEPQPSIAAPVVAPPTVAHAPEGSRSEPTRLSRYYLRSW